MTRRSIALMTVAGLMLGGAASTHLTATVTGFSSLTIASARDQRGRYKQQGNVCEWTADDDGANQCEPQIKGRFKKGEGDSCTWDASELGPDQSFSLATPPQTSLSTPVQVSVGEQGLGGARDTTLTVTAHPLTAAPCKPSASSTGPCSMWSSR